MVYDAQFRPGTAYLYAFSSSMDFDDRGRYLWGGTPTHEGYQSSNRNQINAWTPPAIGVPGDGKVDVLFPQHGKFGWSGTDEFVRWYIPGYEWWVQMWQVVFDLKSNSILASNIAALQAAAGDPVEPIPPIADLIERAGNSADNTGFAPYEPAHAWSREHDCGLTIGGTHSADRGVCIEKQPSAAKPLRIKVWYQPFSARHPENPDYGWPFKEIRSGFAHGDWFYVVGPQYSGWQQSGFINTTPKFLRYHIPSILANPPHARLPDSACQYLPELPFVWPNGLGYAFNGLCSYDSDRKSVIIFNHRVIEFKPADSVFDFAFSDVTPEGYPTLGQILGGYDPVTKAHYISNGFPPSAGASCLNIMRPRVNASGVDIGQPDPSIPLSNGTPLFLNAQRFHRFRFVK